MPKKKRKPRRWGIISFVIIVLITIASLSFYKSISIVMSHFWTKLGITNEVVQNILTAVLALLAVIILGGLSLRRALKEMLDK